MTTCIRGILRDYKDGVGIFKELIQNADDAGATTVKFLVDWRDGRTNSLFTPGMAECQGPALWAYNDAVFTDDDLENITKLSEGTKLDNLSKIGRFGLGFTSVYNLTDVPSFVSREYFVTHDPNLNHLQERIKDRSNPGIRINLAKKPEALARYRDQFQPYNGIFGCSTVHSRSDFFYEGSLFRFPFRTARQANTSDISKTAYSRDKIQAVVTSLCECASTLLLFSQHVKKVEIYELDRLCRPNQMRLVLSVNKPEVEVVKKEEITNGEPFIKQCSKWWQSYRDSQTDCPGHPASLELVTISTKKMPAELSGRACKHSSEKKWFVMSASGAKDSLKVARSPQGRSHGLLPCAGVAFVIQGKTDRDSGELFCFLALSIPTGLPVHVNGCFAIMSNRVEIWKKTNEQNQPIEVIWNEALMEDALARAYIMLLEYMKSYSKYFHYYEFHSLWPNCEVVDMKSWETLVKKVCSTLLQPQSKLFYSNEQWMSIKDGYLLSSDLDEIYEIAVNLLRLLKQHVFNIPCEIVETLEKFDQSGILQSRTLTLKVFMEKFFFPNIKILSPSQRCAIVCFGIDLILKGNNFLVELFQQNLCIPVSRESEIFAKPCQLIHPYVDAAQLYAEKDGRFPIGNGLREKNRLYVLEELGMAKDLNWPEIVERAQYIAKLGYYAGIERCRKLISYLNKRLDQLSVDAMYCNWLKNISFIPVERKPFDDYVLPWKGSKLLSPRLFAPNEVFLPEHAKLVGSSCYIVDTSDQSGSGRLRRNVANVLGFSTRLPEVKFVFQQLDEAISFWGTLTETEKQSTRKRKIIEDISKKVYEFLNNKIAKQGSENESILKELRKRYWLFLQGEFIQSAKVAYSCRFGAPFLFTLPSIYKRDYRHLFEAIEIKQTFTEEDYITALYELQSSKEGCVLTEYELQVAIFFISQIQDVRKPSVVDHIGKIPLPDTQGILRQSKDVVVNLSLCLQDLDNNLKVHEKIPPPTAHALGARLLKNVILKKYSKSVGVSFGQKESLIDRLQELLDGYPADGILKELVQNADDAQASEIHFIHDTRNLGTEKVVTETGTSEEIQGPALCVYNDKPFTEKDLEGIQRLGVGGKRDCPGTTGKYGIGFNSVYHLTDCPSFLSDDNTLVLLDPHCRYAVAADPDNPGEMFSPIDERIRRDFSDTIDGYLGGHFNLKAATMFRFPLRRNHESKIANKFVDMMKLLQTFEKEAKKSLLFLNHIKKITISKIGPDGKLQQVYQVETIITPEDERKRIEIAQKIRKFKGIPTSEIEWEGTSYKLRVKENTQEIEKWLIQQCIGSKTRSLGSIASSEGSPADYQIPDGRTLGLFPRGGLAARLWASSLSSNEQPALRAMVYCFLPLPENYIGLPVHVNGHFALDRHRRGLWTDTDGKGEKSEWNHFINSCVLPPAYAALIMEARYLYNNQGDDHLSSYHALFPEVEMDSVWKTLAVELYRYLGQTRAEVLPLLIPTESKNETNTHVVEQHSAGNFLCTNKAPKAPVHVKCTSWLSVDQAYFVNYDSLDAQVEDVLHLLIRIGLRVLLHCPFRLHRGFQSADTIVHKVTPETVVSFLRSPACNIEQLPVKLDRTVFKNVSELSKLIEYCRENEEFVDHLEGLPLLLTQDRYLRIFDSCKPVFRSKFGDLFPTQSHLFLHSEIVPKIPSRATKAKRNVVRDFTVRNLARLLPHVFTDRMLRRIESQETWKFPTEGILSKKWLKKFWDFLQNHAKPEPKEESISLDCLYQWPVIPTTCGKLVTIKNAEAVLDMTVSGTESGTQENFRAFLTNLKCPMLDTTITFPQNDKSSTVANNGNNFAEEQSKQQKVKKTVLERKAAVTDRYVAHPHNVLDVLVVLSHMLVNNRLDLAGINEKEIGQFLQFVQDNYTESALPERYKQIIKCLPFHKALHGQFLSLTGRYSSYALVPSGVPLQQLDELQEKAKCLFLDSDVLPALWKLYSDLGVRAGQNVHQFYAEYVFKYFSTLNRESQIQHLIYIRDEVYPKLPQGDSDDKEAFLNSMSINRCIPDKHGYLHCAAEFYNPANEVFQIMYEDEPGKFPPSPFNEKSWLVLLKDIGLRSNITKQQFLKFCETVAEAARCSPDNPQLHKRSKILIKCLFSKKKVLGGTEFLSRLSQIHFIAPSTVDKKLTSIQEQYQCQENGHLPFIKFHNAVPWRFRNIAWTTASLLPEWINPDDIEGLGIARFGPTCTEVADHLKNVATSCTSGSIDCNLLHEITGSIYDSLSKFTKRCGGKSMDKCDDNCIKIGFVLKDIPCIFLHEDQVFVKASQLALNFPEKCDFKPFLYSVPEEWMAYRHLFKRLGVVEKIKLLQMAYVLKSIHGHVGEGELSFQEEIKVKWAMHLLFKLLLKGESADTINELYLPSENKRLVKSCELICNVSSRFSEVLKKLCHPVLLRFEECKLEKVADDYITALPNHLRPVKFDDLVQEDVDSDCKVSICPFADRKPICKFQHQFETLLRSDEFQEGLRRLIMDSGKDPKQFESTIKKLQTVVQIRCIGLQNVKIQLIRRDTSVVLSHLEENCYAVQEKGIWTLFLRHESGNRKSPHIAGYVNEILANCIQRSDLLVAILDCSSPSEISQELNKSGIVQSLSESAASFIQPDDDMLTGWDSDDEETTQKDEEDENPGDRKRSWRVRRKRQGGGGGVRFSGDGYATGYLGGGGSGHSRSTDDEKFYQMDSEEAVRWVEQSKVDLEGARWLLESDPPFSALACFQSHQVAEKCFKAMLFADCGISGQLLGSHDVEELGHKVREETEISQNVVRLSRQVKDYYLTTRYPNRQPNYVVPAEAFNKEKAETAVDAASKLLEVVKEHLEV